MKSSSLLRRAVRALSLGGAVVAMTAMSASEAAAQDAEDADRPLASVLFPPGSDTAPPPTVAPPLPPEKAPERFVRLHMRSSVEEDGTPSRIFRVNADGSFAFVCVTPCTEELLPGIRLRIILGRDEQNAQTYVVPKRPGREIHMTVRPVSQERKTAFVVGGVVALAGGASAIVGGALMETGNGSTVGSGIAKLFAGVLVVVGVSAVMTGLVLLTVGPSSRPALDTRILRERAERPRVQLSAGSQGMGFTF